MRRRLLRHTIWAPGAVPESEGTASRELKRVVLPLFDSFIAAMGLAGMILGMPAFREVWATAPSHFAGFLLMAGGVSALAGISFPRLWAAEAVGKLLMILVIGGYATAQWVLTFQQVGERWMVAIAFTALLALPLWNIARLGREWRKRRAIAEVMRLHLAGDR